MSAVAMGGFVLEYLGQLARWLHVVAAIAWIGESFYFVALDRGLKPPRQPLPGLHGESWSVHGGGFYYKAKYLPAPAELPEELHWSKWKSYTTWLSGAALLGLVYFASPAVWLVDPRVMAMSPVEAVWMAVAFPLIGWLAYDALCTGLGDNDGLLGVIIALAVLGLCFATTHVFAGRAAFLLAGATLATIMSANVLFVIIPGQRRMVAALQAGQAPNPLDGARGKQRSVHNTYFTLPVVFAMLSTHFGAAFSHPHNWMFLAGFMATGALIRQFFVLWHSGQRAWWLLGLGGAGLVALGIALAPRPVPAASSAPTTAGAASVAFADIPEHPDTAYVQGLVARHCTDCHSATPRLLPVAPKGVVLDTPEQIEAQASLIRQQVVQLKLMPLGNTTQMTEAEREAFARWTP